MEKKLILICILKCAMEKLTRAQKFHIGIAKQGPYFVSSIISGSMLIFYTDYIGLNPVIFGTAFLIFGFWNAINDPLLGYYSDKSVFQGQKRVTLMKVGVPIMLIGFMMVILQQSDTAVWLMFCMLLAGLLTFEAGKAIFDVNYGAYSISVIQDPQERTKLNMIVSYIGFIPGALVGIIPTWFLTGSYTHGEVLILFLCMTLIPCAISWYSVNCLRPLNEIYLEMAKKRENAEESINSLEDHTKDPAENLATEDINRNLQPISVKTAFKETLQSKSFHYLIAYRTFAAFFQGVYYTNLIYMMKGVLGISGIWALLIAGVGGLMMNGLYPLLTHFRKKYGTIRVLISTQLIAVPGYIIMFFSFNIPTLLIGYGLSAVALSGLYLFEAVLLGDVTDKDFLDSGKEKRGLFVAINGFFATLAGAFSVFLTTILLAYYDYNPDLEIQTLYTQGGIRIMASVVPIIGILIGIIFLRFFPLQGEKYKVFREEYIKFVEKNPPKAR
jgi:glycoside/pentoside/hexuronide:cation symporter, GPH family